MSGEGKARGGEARTAAPASLPGLAAVAAPVLAAVGWPGVRMSELR